MFKTNSFALVLLLSLSSAYGAVDKIFATVADRDGNVYRAGSTFDGSKNHAWVSKTTNGGSLLWKNYYDQTTVANTHAYLLFIDPVNNDPWVVFDVTRGSTDASSIRNLKVSPGAFSDVLFSSYGLSQDSEVTVNVIAVLDPRGGEIRKGTFMMSKLKNGDINVDGKTNSFLIQTFSVTASDITFDAVTKYAPSGTGSSANNFVIAADATSDKRDADGFFSMSYAMSKDLKQITKATVLAAGTLRPSAGLDTDTSGSGTNAMSIAFSYLLSLITAVLMLMYQP
eukprot:TRINITY_DN10522_c0_g1_i1.p1 TRINITY_DN10522_c0_g1~~TRINITY_DN10522_c0_g1_i1.p1  ORF type:complete len:283 (-),score=34.78 TRINITY_DN10522_c0_g1_i1:235-1083(-)